MKKAIALRVKIKELCHKHGITQKQLAEQTGIREGTISELANSQRTTFNKEQLLTVMNFFKLERLDELIEITWVDIPEPKPKRKPGRPKGSTTKKKKEPVVEGQLSIEVPAFVVDEKRNLKIKEDPTV